MFEFLRRRKPQITCIANGTSFHARAHELVISNLGIFYTPNPRNPQGLVDNTSFAELVMGAPGLPNVKKKLYLGDAVIYQTPNYGVVEVRVMELFKESVHLMITVVTPRSGFSAGFDDTSTLNAQFSTDEIDRIKNSVDRIVTNMSTRADVNPEQLDFLRSKLSEIALASSRLGRKDWIMFVIGTLTNVITSVAFPPEAAKALISFLNAELSWVFQNALRLLGS